FFLLNKRFRPCIFLPVCLLFMAEVRSAPVIGLLIVVYGMTTVSLAKPNVTRIFIKYLVHTKYFKRMIDILTLVHGIIRSTITDRKVESIHYATTATEAIPSGSVLSNGYSENNRIRGVAQSLHYAGSAL